MKQDTFERNTAIHELMKEGLGPSQISNALGLSYGVVKGVIQRIRANGGELTFQVPEQVQRNDRIMRLLAQGICQAEIARRLGLTPDAVKSVIRNRKSRGTYDRMHRRNRRIVKLWSSGVVVADIAGRMKVSTDTVVRVLRKSLGPRTPGYGQPRTSVKRRVFELLDEGHKQAEIARMLGVERRVISGHVHRYRMATGDQNFARVNFKGAGPKPGPKCTVDTPPPLVARKLQPATTPLAALLAQADALIAG